MASVSVKGLSRDRVAERASWAAVRDLCCRTGNNGDPIAPERWQLFSRIWIEPYELLLPDWTYVAEDAGLMVGYLTGCPDSRKFFRQKAWHATLPLMISIACGRYRHDSGAAAFAKQAVGIRHSAERCFSRLLQREITSTYPAHLHINVDARYRRRGVGRQLVDRYFGDLRRRAVPGVHLYCGKGPVPFYRSLGFEVLESVEVRGHSTFAMGIHL